MDPDDGNPAQPLRAEDAFDVEAVSGWLAEHGRAGVVDVRQFAGGASNLTYLLTLADGGELILRRPPVGAKAAGAHDMGREYTIQRALAPAFGYVPTMVGHCTDDAVLGSEFYVMEKVDGVIPRRELGLDLTPAATGALCQNALEVLVALHAVDVSALPDLVALDRGEGFVGRQVRGWTRRFAAARTDDTGDWSDVEAWIEAHQPADVGRVMIHHDFRFDNMVLRPDPDGDPDVAPEVVGVLDWELATVGDPLMDLASALAYWIQSDDDEFLQSFRRQPTNAPGMWTREEFRDRYCASVGIEMTAQRWRFYEVFGLYRLAVIAQQIWYRYALGQTTNESYAVFGPAVGHLERRCRAILAG